MSETNYGILILDPTGGDNGGTIVRWDSMGGRPLEEAARDLATWDRVTGPDGHRTYALALAEYEGPGMVSPQLAGLALHTALEDLRTRRQISYEQVMKARLEGLGLRALAMVKST